MPKSDPLQSLLENKAPKNIRLAAARGSVPLPPDGMLQLLVHLLNDSDPEVASQATSTLQSWPERDVLAQISTPECSARVIEHFAFCGSSIPIFEAILLNPSTEGPTIAKLALRVSPSLLELILDNRVRLLECPAILTNLKLNPALTPALHSLVQQIETEFFGSKKSDYSVGAATQEAEGPAEAFEVADALAEVDFLLEGLPVDPEAREGALIERLAKMTVRQKIHVAMRGTREERTVLIRDSNREVARSVLRSPKISDNEIEVYASMRNVSDEILREIGNNREWTKRYTVAQTLVKNPKTPPGVSQRMLSHLHSRDLFILARDRGIPEAVRRNAQRMLHQRAAPKR